MEKTNNFLFIASLWIIFYVIWERILLQKQEMGKQKLGVSVKLEENCMNFKTFWMGPPKHGYK